MRNSGKIEAVKRGYVFLLVVSLLVACAPAAILPAETPTATLAQTPSVTPSLTPTDTLTNTPTATAIPTPEPDVDIETWDEWAQQYWVRQVLWNATYDVGNINPDIANALPWTVDENGYMLQGVTNIHFGSANHDGDTFLVFLKKTGGLSPSEVNLLESVSSSGLAVGPSFAIEALRGPIPVRFVGDLTPEVFAEMQNFFFCVGVSGGVIPTRIERFSSSNVKVFELTGVITDFSKNLRLDYCLDKIQ